MGVVFYNASTRCFMNIINLNCIRELIIYSGNAAVEQVQLHLSVIYCHRHGYCLNRLATILAHTDSSKSKLQNKARAVFGR